MPDPQEQRTVPNAATREAERAEFDEQAGPDREPTPEEEAAAPTELDPDVADHAEEMYRIGAEAKGEGRIP